MPKQYSRNSSVSISSPVASERQEVPLDFPYYLGTLCAYS